MMFSFTDKGTPRRSLGVSVVVLVAVAALLGLARTAEAQTPFSLQNIGQRVASDDARMVGRGGWGMAVHDTLNIGAKNVASLAYLKYVALKFTGYGDLLHSTESSRKRMNTRVLSPDVRVASPVFNDRLVLTAGFNVYRSMQYHTRKDTMWGEAWGDTIYGNEQYERIGTRFRVPLGGAMEILPGVSIGATINLEEGSLKGTLVNNFVFPAYAPSGTPFYSTNLKETYDEYSGTSQTYGIVLSPFSWLQAGASWTPSHTIDASREVVQIGVSQVALSSYSMGIPDEYMAGIQLQPFGRWRLGADGQYQEYTKFTGPEDWMNEMEDEYTLAFGIERTQGYVRRGGSSNLPIRLGARFHRWAYRVGGEPVDEWLVSIGTGFSFRGNMGVLDVSLSHGMIGDLGKNGVETEVTRLTISVTGLEKWW